MAYTDINFCTLCLHKRVAHSYRTNVLSRMKTNGCVNYGSLVQAINAARIKKTMSCFSVDQLRFQLKKLKPSDRM